MGKALVLIQNKDERATARQMLQNVDSLAMFGNLSDGLAEIKKDAAGITLLIVDERFDQSVDSKNANLKIIDLLEAFMESGRSLNAVVAVILNESTVSLEMPVLYAEEGADLFLRRPYGIEELRERLDEAVAWIDSPPPLVKLIRILQDQVHRKNYSEILIGLESLHQKHPQHVRIGMLLAKTLIHMGGEGRSRGLSIALQYDQQYPESLFTKKLLVEGYLFEKKVPEAFRMALSFYGCNPSDAAFDRAYHLADILSKQSPQSFDHWLEFLKIFEKLDPPRTRDRRVQILRHFTELNPSPVALASLFAILRSGYEDVLPSLLDSLEKWIATLRTVYETGNKSIGGLELILVDALKLLLDLDSGAPAALEVLTDISISRKDYKMAEKYLNRARDDHKYSVEFYSAFTKLALEEGLLKEASDMMHAGRRMAPSDDRWTPLAKVWAEKFASRKDS